MKFKLYEDFNIVLKNRDKINSILRDYGFTISVDELCYQLTAFERYGSVDYEKSIGEVLLNYGMDEKLSLSDYLDYLADNEDTFWYPLTEDEIDDALSPYLPHEIIDKIYSSNHFSWNDDYFTITDVENIDTATDTHLEDQMINNEDFIQYFCQNTFVNLFDNEVKTDILNGVNQLLQQGY